MKKLICLFLQVISLCMWFVYIVDKEKVGLLFNSRTHAENSAIQVIYILIATTLLFISIIGFLSPDKPCNNNYKKFKSLKKDNFIDY